MEQLVILLVIGAISLVNWLLQRSAELREKRKLESRGTPAGSPPAPHTGPPPVSRRAEADPAESMRKLMEALGLPVEEAPPKIPPREPAPPPVPEASAPASPPPPARREFPAPVERPSRPLAEARAFEKDLEEYARKIETVPARPVLPQPPRPIKPHKPAASVAHVRPGRFRRMLSDRASVRDAVVLSEILGQPKSLR